MNPLLSKSTSVCLAALYALLVIAGHALHDHGDFGPHHGHEQCDHTHAQSDIQAAIEKAEKNSPHCSCSCDHHQTGEVSAHRAEPVVASSTEERHQTDCAANRNESANRLTLRLHDPHSCLACQLISQLKVGYSFSVETEIRDPLPGEVSWSYQAPLPDSVDTIYVARGPPALS